MDLKYICYFCKNSFELLLNIIKLSGIKSNTDTLNITPAAKANEYLIILFLFPLININNDPIKVEKPAIKHNKKGSISFITPHLFKYMKKI